MAVVVKKKNKISRFLIFHVIHMYIFLLRTNSPALLGSNVFFRPTHDTYYQKWYILDGDTNTHTNTGTM